MDGGAWWAAVYGVAKSRAWLSDFTFTFYFHALEKEMATHSSVLAWRIPGTGKPGGLPSMGSHRVGHKWSDLAAAAAAGFVESSITLFYKYQSLICCIYIYIYISIDRINSWIARIKKNDLVSTLSEILTWKHFYFLKQNWESVLFRKLTETKMKGLPQSNLKHVYYFVILNFAKLCFVIISLVFPLFWL